jgi:hypothetical protein
MEAVDLENLPELLSPPRSRSPIRHARAPSGSDAYWSEIERAEIEVHQDAVEYLSTDDDVDADIPLSPSKLRLSDETPAAEEAWTARHDTIFKAITMVPCFIKGTCEAIAVPYFLEEGIPFATAFLVLCASPLLLREVEPFLEGSRLWLSISSCGLFLGSMLMICSSFIGEYIASDPHHVHNPSPRTSPRAQHLTSHHQHNTSPRTCDRQLEFTKNESCNPRLRCFFH